MEEELGTTPFLDIFTHYCSEWSKVGSACVIPVECDGNDRRESPNLMVK